MHENLEVLFDPDFYFKEYGSFTEDSGVVNGDQGVAKVVARIFDKYDEDKDGILSRDEALNMMHAEVTDKWSDYEVDIGLQKLSGSSAVTVTKEQI